MCHYHCFIFILKLSHSWLVGDYSNQLLCLSNKSPSFFQHFLAFWKKKAFQTQLILSPSQCWNPQFLQGALVSFEWAKIFSSQDLGISYAYYYWDFPAPGPLSEETRAAHTHTHRDVNVRAYVCL